MRMFRQMIGLWLVLCLGFLLTQANGAESNEVTPGSVTSSQLALLIPETTLDLQADRWLRPGVPLRFAIRTEQPVASGPGTVVAFIRDGMGTWGTVGSEIPDLSQLHTSPLQYVLVPAPPLRRLGASATSLSLGIVVEVTRQTGARVGRGFIPLELPERLLQTADAWLTDPNTERRLAARQIRVALGRTADPWPPLLGAPPAPWGAGGVADIAGLTLAESVVRMERALDPEVGSTARWLSVPDAADGSVQPARCWGDLTTATGVAVLLLHQPEGRPANLRSWFGPDPRWLATASAAGMAVVQAYPAGDGAWRGVAWRRLNDLRTYLTERMRPDRAPVIVAVGAVAPELARAPERSRGYPARAITDPQALLAPETWQAIRDTGTRFQPPIPGKASETAEKSGLPAWIGWSQGPAVVVVGSGESTAAAADARRAAARFTIAYARHAQAVLPMVSDSDFDARRFAEYHLILCGAWGANRLTRTILPSTDLPLQWDHRLVKAGAQQAPRTLLTGAMAALRDPNAPRWLLILDGDVDLGPGLPASTLGGSGDQRALLQGPDTR
jgi:hypothetical protein